MEVILWKNLLISFVDYAAKIGYMHLEERNFINANAVKSMNWLKRDMDGAKQ